MYDMIKEGSAPVASAVDPKAAVLSRKPSRKPTMEPEALQHPGLSGGSAQAFSQRCLPVSTAAQNPSPSLGGLALRPEKMGDSSPTVIPQSPVYYGLVWIEFWFFSGDRILVSVWT